MAELVKIENLRKYHKTNGKEERFDMKIHVSGKSFDSSNNKTSRWIEDIHGKGVKFFCLLTYSYLLYN